jgi:hypothetical protein
MSRERQHFCRSLWGHLLWIALMATRPAAAQSAGGAAGGNQPGGSGGNSGKAVQPTSVKYVEFDHLRTDGNRAYVLKLNDGEPFQVKVLNTCPAVFSYEVQGIVRQEESQNGLRLNAGPEQPLEEKVLPVVHDEKYGGYLVTIRRTLDTLGCKDSDKLVARTLIISTPKMSWDLAFSGGFTVSTLTSPHYYLRPHPTEAGKTQVQEDTSKNDDANLGIATWVQVYHHSHPGLAGTFGIGIRDANKTEYYLGGGFRMSDKASINGGVVFGPVSRLKDGIGVGDTVTDPNILSDLPTKTTLGYFIGLSYSFIDVRGKLQQPFAGASGASGATGTTGTTPPAGTPPAPGPSATPAPGAGTTPAPTAAGGTCQATFDNDPAKNAVSVGKDPNAFVSVTISVSPAGCAWTVTGNPIPWATISPMSGTGNGAVRITATQTNVTGNDRTENALIGGKLLKITQSK